jgi:diguanylate cyclase (GGDEF)-like protein/PAS domain S-box-containing protein
MEPTLQQGISDPAGAPRRPEPRGAERLDELLRIVLDRSTDPIIVLDSALRVVEWSLAATRMFRLSHAAARGRVLPELILSDWTRDRDRKRIRTAVSEGTAGRPSMPVEIRAERKDGTPFTAELTFTRVADTELVVCGLRQPDQASEAGGEGLAPSRNLEFLARLPSVAYRVQLDELRTCRHVSPQIEQMLGYTPDEWMGDPTLWLDGIHPEDRTDVIEQQRRSVEASAVFDLEYRLKSRSGTFVWVRDTGVTSATAGGATNCIEGLLTDISVHKRREQRLRVAGGHDTLTGLASRPQLEEELERRIAAAGHGAVAIFDVDNLRFVNDSMGHSAGDEVLQSIGGMLGEMVRTTDLVARLAGDEFVVLLDGVDGPTALARANQILEAIRTRRQPIELTASAGVTSFGPPRSPSAADLLVAADIALEEAKDAGRDRAVLSTTAGPGRIVWMNRVRKAIDEKRLVLYRQPILDMKTGATVRHELLIRLFDGKEMLAPGLWLPAAERGGLIGEIDRWVTEQALKLVGDGQPVSVNLSAHAIQDPGLTDFVERELAASEADPSRLMFEITETSAARTVEELSGFAERIGRIGCGVAIDDFGTGFASFTYLKHLRANYLKIDMEFVRTLPASPEDQRIVRSTVALAQSMGLQTVAEGVEDEETAVMIKEFGVDFGQGYHFGRPEPTPIPGQLGHWLPLSSA